MLNQEEILRQEYNSRINNVVNYIYNHLDDEDLNHNRLADIACFSRYHFHRIFKAMIGETLGAFIKRLRLEKSTAFLSRNPKMTITDIALECGFSSSSTYARAFKERYGMSASEFRNAYYLSYSPKRKLDSKECKLLSKFRETFSNAWQAPEASMYYIENVNKNVPRRLVMEMKKVEVREMPEMNVIYVRHIGPYNEIEGAWNKLCTWAGPRGLLGNPDQNFLGIYYDNPEVTEPAKLRSDACVTVPEGTKVDGDIGTMKIPSGKYACALFEIAPDEFGAAWDKFMNEWLPESGYQPDDRLCYELYLNNAAEHPEGHFILELCQPVKPL